MSRLTTAFDPGSRFRGSRGRSAALAVALAVALAGVPGCFRESGPTSPALPVQVVPKPPKADPVDPVGGLKRSDRQAFYHLAEGSEVYPLALLLALDDPKTGKPFLQDSERFGFIDDPDPADDAILKLPIGLTTARSRDLRFANVTMVGITCSACHVGAIEYQGKPVLRIDGAPNTLDLKAYYTDLAAATKATLASPSASWTFLGRVYKMHRYTPSLGATAPGANPGSSAAAKKKGGGVGAPKPARSAAFVKESRRFLLNLTMTNSQERALFAPPPGTETGQGPLAGVAGLPIDYPNLDDLKQAGPLQRALAEAVEQAHAREMARPAPDFLKGLAFVPEPAKAGPSTSTSTPAPAPVSIPRAEAKALADYAAALHGNDERALDRFGSELTEASAALRGVMLGEVSRPEIPGLPEAEASSSTRAEGIHPALLPDLVRDFVETLRLLRARAEFLAQLGSRPAIEATETGPGRLDAFGGARNLVFPDDPASETAPINFPHLWGVERTSWYQWDGGTNSLIERNVGQAIGTGAVLVRPDFLSTVIVPNVERLERITYGIRPPSWPESAFGAIDRAKFERGAAVFRERCADCHAPAADGQKAPDRLYTLDEIGTDPNRAHNFARPVKGRPFHSAISEVLRGTIRKAGGSSMESKPGVWRTTGKYPGRPLLAIWATPPFLHNGSVPTLYHLLLPEDQRPKTFVLGHREYDPKHLGYTVEGDPAPARHWVFDTTKPGNSNKGHSGPKFGTDLPELDREALLEYLKANERADPSAAGR